jgi:hypothetical protein
MTADVIDINEVRLVRGLLECALNDGTSAEELRMTLALCVVIDEDDSRPNPEIDYDRLGAELKHLVAIGCVDRRDYGLD